MVGAAGVFSSLASVTCSDVGAVFVLAASNSFCNISAAEIVDLAVLAGTDGFLTSIPCFTKGSFPTVGAGLSATIEVGGMAAFATGSDFAEMLPCSLQAACAPGAAAA